ncbi:SpoIIE family protein phosphatase [Shewanella sp. SP1S2-4]|uniref:SpoIIE family protein phosphatase n=1 Tax=Shewanella sp. SP1S2-4 TaxID=3063537 RepID=UPI00288CC46F|nr:SpoIIE family protein phosphatase [Shewanella sp. SP1S2-4]MDT3322260.1 SpoIIE family protein phosphatase [Shewanella sp. SP1S2-4]
MPLSSITTQQPEILSVLVVEDTESERLFICNLLRQFGWLVESCNSAYAALAYLKHSSVHVVISDWRMPGMTGIELCQILKNVNLPPFVILLTANNQTADIVLGIEAGADDFICKPFNPALLKVRMLAAMRIMQLQQNLAKKNQLLHQGLEKETALLNTIQKDLISAAKVQRELLPRVQELPNNWQLHHRFQPANYLAGDTFQCFDLGENQLGFYLIDAAGHGITAALQSVSLAQRLSMERTNWHQQSPNEIVNALNQELSDPDNTGRFVTLLLGKINTSNGEVQICSAGHPSPLLLTNSDCESLVLETELPIGIHSAIQYKNQNFKIKPGTRLILFSDGAYECKHEKFGIFGLDRLQQLCEKAKNLSSEQLLHHLSHALKLWQCNNIQDDISMMLITYPSQLMPRLHWRYYE